MTTPMQPDTAIRVLLRAATARREERFVVLAVSTYFNRIMNASVKKLRAYGLRPVVAPVAAELALMRSMTARSFPEFIARLIGEDADAADLVIRAVRLYAERFASMAAQDVEKELGASDADLCVAAQVIHRNLSFISPTLA